MSETSPAFPPKLGSLRWRNGEGKVFMSEPGDLLFSMACFTAEEYWDGKEWCTIRHWPTRKEGRDGSLPPKTPEDDE